MLGTPGHKSGANSSAENTRVNEREGDQRWALIGLLLWTPAVLGLITEAIYLVGHWMFRTW